MVTLAVIVKSDNCDVASRRSIDIITEYLMDLEEPVEDRFHRDLEAYAYDGGFETIRPPTEPETKERIVDPNKYTSYCVENDLEAKRILESPTGMYVYDAVASEENDVPIPTPLTPKSTRIVLECSPNNEYVTCVNAY